MGKRLSDEERQRREAIAEAKRQAKAKTVEENRLKREALDAEILARRNAGTRQLTTLNDICFPVEMRDNERITNQEYSKVVTGIINNEEVDLNYCSPRYELVPNETIFPKVEEILKEKGIAYSVEYTHIQNARFYGLFTIEDPRFSYTMKGTKDKIKFIWNFQHSYNGLTKYKGVAGFFRLVCTNGLTVPVQEMKDYNLEIQGKHTASIVHSLADFSQILVDVLANLGTVKTAITDKYEKLGGVWVPKPEDRIKEVLQANKIAMIETPKLNTVNDIMSKITFEADKDGLGYDGRVNNWLIYNGINQYLNDDNLNIASPEKRRDKDSAVLEYMLEY